MRRGTFREVMTPAAAGRRHRIRRKKSPSVAVRSGTTAAASATVAATRRDSASYGASCCRHFAVRLADALLNDPARTTPHDNSGDTRIQTDGVCSGHCRHRRVVGGGRVQHERRYDAGAPGARVDAAARRRAYRLRGLGTAARAEESLGNRDRRVARATRTRATARVSPGASRFGLSRRGAHISPGFPHFMVVP